MSNSSWANQGYLVAAEVEGADTMKELRLLAAAHGIGLIVLDLNSSPETPATSPTPADTPPEFLRGATPRET